jgi:hypothetical protein
MKTKGKISTILILIATVVLAGVAIFTAFRLYKLRQEAVAPNAPSSRPAAAECPRSDGVLDNGLPSGESICNSTYAGNRIEPCGGQQYCCTTSGWSTNLSACSNASPTASASPIACSTLVFAIATPTPGTPNSCGGTCGSDNNCSSGLYCNGGYCRNPNCPSDIDCVCATATPTPTSTSTATSTPRTYTATPTPTGEPALPTAGTSWPTVLGASTGILLLIGSLLLIL